jgi:hypothetical protein
LARRESPRAAGEWPPRLAPLQYHGAGTDATRAPRGEEAVCPGTANRSARDSPPFARSMSRRCAVRSGVGEADNVQREV